MKQGEWKADPVYVGYVRDLLEHPEVQRLANFVQHHATTRLEHCITVSYESYRIARRLHLDARATARAGPSRAPSRGRAGRGRRHRGHRGSGVG